MSFQDLPDLNRGSVRPAAVDTLLQPFDFRFQLPFLPCFYEKAFGCFQLQALGLRQLSARFFGLLQVQPLFEVCYMEIRARASPGAGRAAVHCNILEMSGLVKVEPVSFIRFVGWTS
jgi:hypothetical protein